MTDEITGDADFLDDEIPPTKEEMNSAASAIGAASVSGSGVESAAAVPSKMITAAVATEMSRAFP